ncbi:MAG: sodium:solute symporter family protein [Deltaproteobacteria bacterium]|nr:sodium:solute symporter family protein [Deltaproteobacteria bacterium]
MNSIIIGIFLVGMIIVGILSMKKIKTSMSYFVADRNGGSVAISGSLIATLIGGSSTIGLAGLGYSKGLVGAWWLLVGAIGLLILSFWLARKVREYAVFTLPEILERQYGGNSTKIVASLVVATAWLGIIAGQIIAAGKILSVLWPGHSELLMILAASVFVTYTVLGGQYSILRTDLIQSGIIVAGLSLCLMISLPAAGGLTAVMDALPPSYFAFPVSPSFGWMDLAGFLLFVGSAYLVGPDIYSRIFCSRSPEVARRSVMFAGFTMIPLAFFIVMIGITARVILPGIPAESALPALIMKSIPAGLSGLIIAALLAAVMSSADTCLLTTSTILTADVIDPLRRSKMTERQLLLVSRIGVVIIGAISLLIAVTLKGIIASLLLGYTVYTSGLVIPVLLGFYSKHLKLNSFGVIAAVVGGGGMGLLLKLSGYNNLSLMTLPLSALLLFGGSYCSRYVGVKETGSIVQT